MVLYVLPEANYITTDYRNYIRVVSILDTFVACIAKEGEDCIPGVYNKPWKDFDALWTGNHIVKYGVDSDLVEVAKVFTLSVAFVEEDAWMFWGIYTDPDGKKHFIYKVGYPVDVPGVDEGFLFMKNGDILHSTTPAFRETYEKVADQTNYLAFIESLNMKWLGRPKFGWWLIPIIIAGIATGGWIGVTWIHETQETERVRDANNKFFEFLDKIREDVQRDPKLADTYAGILEGLYGTMYVSTASPKNINPHATTQQDTNPFNQFIDWIKQNWYYLFIPLIGVIVLVFKWQAIVEFFRGVLDSLRDLFRRRR